MKQNLQGGKALVMPDFDPNKHKDMHEHDPVKARHVRTIRVLSFKVSEMVDHWKGNMIHSAHSKMKELHQHVTSRPGPM